MSNDISDDQWAQRVYLMWLARDTRYALTALTALIAYAQSTPVPPVAWVCFEDFLSFLGKVSRTLWPAHSKGPNGTDRGLEWRTKRGPFLRKILEVEDSSPLKAREVRNGSEHFDERLDEWIVSLPRPTVEECQAGTKPTFPAPPIRFINVEARTIQVAGADLDLLPMAEELQRLLAKVEELEPSVAVLPADMAALLATSFSPVPIVPFNAPAQNPGGIQAWLDEQNSTDLGAATEDTEA
ncbi:hypothetical protein [Streptomyces murinus]|uniref:hypothetical protein n=1 Tax=Streptomyces murinus TaxID=33900 RepID=UPI00382670BD